MRKFVLIILSVLPVILVSFAFVPRSLAQSNFRQGKQTILPKNEKVDENFFATGDTVQISGTVNGDVYAASGNLIIDGVVNGDVLVAGGNVYIPGKVAGNVRAAGGQVNITGEVGKNALIAGGQIMVSSGSKFAGSLTAVGGNIEIKSPIGGSLEVGGGNLLVDEKISKNVTFAGGNLQLGNEAKVGGNVIYYSEQQAVVLSGATVGGEIKQNLPPAQFKEAQDSSKRVAPAFFKFWMLISFSSALVIGSLISKFTPVFIQKTADKIKGRFLANLGLGFVVVVITPFAVFGLLISVIGIPLAGILLTLYLLLLYVAKIFAAFYLGQLLTRRATKIKSLYFDVLVGLMIYYLLSLVPVLGWIAQTVFVLTSIGALLQTKKEIYATLGNKI